MMNRTERPGRSRLVRVLAVATGALLSCGVASAATNWIVGLDAGSSAQAQSASIANLTIAAVASPAPGSLLFPGGTGDAVVTISNPNSFPVTITDVQLPANTVAADGYTTAALSTLKTGCTSATPSAVTWRFATASTGSSHALTTPLTVAANGTLVATLSGVVSMGASSPLACAATYFKMPSFTGVTATGGAATATSSPATSGWTA